MTPALSHSHVHLSVIIVHEDTITMTGLILLLDHPDVMIGVMYLDMIIVIEKIILTSLMIGIITIERGITVLATMIGDMTT